MSEGGGRGDTKRSIAGGKRKCRFQQKFHRALAGSLLLTAMLCPAIIVPAMAQTTGASSAPLAQSAQSQQFNIPPQSLIPALIKFTDVTGIQLFFDSTMAHDLKSPGVTGAMPREEALRRLLAGTGLTYRFTNATTVTLEKLPTTANSAMTLPPVRVEGQAGPPSTAVVGNLPPPYAGGQVATGGQLGMLGNKSVMDTPFNQTSYTAQTIEDQQARTIYDVLENDPSVRQANAQADVYTSFMIRGFDVTGGDIGLNGLYGIAPPDLTSMDSIERVEVLKGPSALLNGMPPNGSIGGSINLVTKQAGDEPLTRFTTSYISRGQFREHVDIGRRFGADKACGARFNGSYAGGDAAIKNSSSQIGTAALALDCHTDRLRVAADFGYQNDDIDGVTRFVRFASGVPVLRAPAADKLFIPPWTYSREQDKFGMIRAEYDLAPNVTTYGAFGLHDNHEEAIRTFVPTITNVSGDYTSEPQYDDTRYKNLAAQFGVRATVDTGPVNHALNFNGSIADSTYYTSNGDGSDGDDFTSNIYHPVAIPLQSLTHPPALKDSYQSLTSFGVADTLSILDKRIQLTLGVRHQEVLAEQYDNYAESSTIGALQASYDKSAWTPAFALVVKPWENVSLYANYIEGLQQGDIVGSDYANTGQIYFPLRG